METSLFIARIVGPLLGVSGLATLINRTLLEDIGREFLDSKALLFLAGVMALITGLVIVNTHNIWIAGWPVMITAFGWIAVVAGVVRIAFPSPHQANGLSDVVQPPADGRDCGRSGSDRHLAVLAGVPVTGALSLGFARARKPIRPADQKPTLRRMMSIAINVSAIRKATRKMRSGRRSSSCPPITVPTKPLAIIASVSGR